MKIKVYKHIHTNKMVDFDEARDYVIDRLGLKMEIKGFPNDDQVSFLKDLNGFLDELVDWFFSGNWIEDWREI